MQSAHLHATLLGFVLLGAAVACGGPQTAPAVSLPTSSLSRASAGWAPTKPAPDVSPVSAGTPTQFAAPEGAGDSPAAEAIPETRLLTMDFPARLRTGDAEIIRLSLQVDRSGHVTPTAEFQGNVTVGKSVDIADAFGTHTVVAQARLDLAGLEIQPAGDINEPLLPGEDVEFRWRVRGSDPGMYSGTVWLFLVLVDRVSLAQSRVLLSAQSVEIRVTDLLGLTGSLARLGGVIGSFVGCALGFPFATDIVQRILKRLRSRH